MKIVAGLGNPEKRYQTTYHNLGFIAIDNVAEKLNLKFKLKSSLNCTLVEGMLGGEKFVLVKPTTYMNLSGECIKKVLSYYKCQPSDLMVIYDDIDIDIGQIRFRLHGSSGTHNGMRNITSLINSTEFLRVRIGSKPLNDNIPLISYVLSNINESEYPAFNKAIERSALLVIDYLSGKSNDFLMQEYNQKIV